MKLLLKLIMIRVLVYILLCLFLISETLYSQQNIQTYIEHDFTSFVGWQNKSAGNADVKLFSDHIQLYDFDDGRWQQAVAFYDGGSLKRNLFVQMNLKFDSLCTSTQIDTMDGTGLDGKGVWDGVWAVPRVGAELAISNSAQRLVILFLHNEIWVVNNGFVFQRIWKGKIEYGKYQSWSFLYEYKLASTFLTIYRNNSVLVSNKLVGYDENSKNGWVEIIAKGDQVEPTIWDIKYIKIEHSEEVIVSVSEPKQKNKELLLNIFPNPFNTSTQIQISSPIRQRAFINIYDITGSEMVTKSIALLPTINKFNFDFGNFSSGVYILKLTTENNLLSEKLIVIK